MTFDKEDRDNLDALFTWLMLGQPEQEWNDEWAVSLGALLDNLNSPSVISTDGQIQQYDH